jgi:mRNA-degrading endonuclease RelE of RelBE toxin-antitoxin system
MNPDSPSLLAKNWAAAELRKLPAEQRNAILEAAATLAEDIYRHDPSLTEFEAFGEVDHPFGPRAE